MLVVWLLSGTLFGKNKELLNKNINTMKDAALSYYTDEMLPTKIDEKSKVTLNKLIQLDLIEELKYGSDKVCDSESSYVEVQKRDDDYLMTIYIKCGKNKKTTEVKLNKYDYCKTTLCEEITSNSADKPICTLVVSEGTLGVNDWYRSDVTIKFDKLQASDKAKISEYGIGTKKDYNDRKEYKVTKDGVTEVYGYIKDSNGVESTCNIVVQKDTTKPTCSLTFLNNKDNNREIGFKDKKDDLSGIDIYGISTSNEALYNGDEKINLIKNSAYIVYGYVKDKAGNTNKCSFDIKMNNASNTNLTNNTNKKPSTSNKNKGLSCQLEVHKGTKNQSGIYTTDVVVKFKNITTVGSKVNGYGIGKKTTYSKNSSYTITDNGVHTVYGYVKTEDGSTTKCSIKITKDSRVIKYEYSKKITYSVWSNWKELEYNPSNPPKFEKTNTKEVEDLGKKEIKSYVYSVGNAIYLNKLNKINTLTESICKGYDYYRVGQNTYAVKRNQEWVYQGTVKYNTTPTETIDVKYVFDKLDWNCGTCTTPNVIWKKYTRPILTVINSKTLKTSSGSTEKCSGVVNGSVLVYNNYRQIVAFNQSRKEVNNAIYLYRYRTRELLSNPYMDYKYSVLKQDMDLLDAGYKLTGKTVID